MKRSTKFGLALLVSNTLAFGSVGLQKNLLRMDPERAAVINHYGSIPFVNDLGYSLGHKVFFHDGTYKSTANENGTKKDLWYHLGWPIGYESTEQDSSAAQGPRG